MYVASNPFCSLFHSENTCTFTQHIHTHGVLSIGLYLEKRANKHTHTHPRMHAGMDTSSHSIVEVYAFFRVIMLLVFDSTHIWLPLFVRRFLCGWLNILQTGIQTVVSLVSQSNFISRWTSWNSFGCHSRWFGFGFYF